MNLATSDSVWTSLPFAGDLRDSIVLGCVGGGRKLHNGAVFVLR